VSGARQYPFSSRHVAHAETFFTAFFEFFFVAFFGAGAFFTAFFATIFTGFFFVATAFAMSLRLLSQSGAPPRAGARGCPRAARVHCGPTVRPEA
jgi:hypothetical protein